ncbi:rod shape-determining protein [Flavobacterium sp. CYK-55]|uniref:Ppx/GppA phosphatase family protein n=1 Tax=Flavobacterium sp. CYK-55 TaxID=2835529 RepID=UPI001BCB8C0C|nr:rod shape-determining protein [Flavobacterium sp. CYK-55]MBS7786575.1 rod shape-determining protein [Flavobacterium sp. CYK-55]
MITIRKFAAIDIGSNAMRLLVANVIEEPGVPTHFSKSALVRLPIRLGQDSFTVGQISPENIERMIDGMKAFKLLMKVHKVERYAALATSAMREAVNSPEVIKTIKEQADIDIKIIDGKTEAAIIASTDLSHLVQTEQTYLFVDVGGGSTEFSLFDNGKMVASKSFKIGTVRLLNEMVDPKTWDEIEQWIKEQTRIYPEVTLIGSGGNINKLFKMSGRKLDKPLSYWYLNKRYHFLNSLTYEQRISELDLNMDRADVIVLATEIYLNAMKWSRAKKIFVPKIGLSDGIIKAMYFNKI